MVRFRIWFGSGVEFNCSRDELVRFRIWFGLGVELMVQKMNWLGLGEGQGSHRDPILVRFRKGGRGPGLNLTQGPLNCPKVD